MKAWPLFHSTTIDIKSQKSGGVKNAKQRGHVTLLNGHVVRLKREVTVNPRLFIPSPALLAVHSPPRRTPP